MVSVRHVLATAILLFLSVSLASAATYYVDIRNPACSDSGAGTTSQPWCTLSKASTVVSPGDTVNVREGRYPQEFDFTRSGTASAPVRYRATGNVVVGSFDDVRDEAFQPTAGTANVYEMPRSQAPHYNDITYQTYFPPFIVDDDNPGNPSNFTVMQSDGPLMMAKVQNLADVGAVEGSWYVGSNKLYVHPYGNRVPSSAATDIVLSVNSWSHDVHASYNEFDGFTFGYNAENEMQNLGDHNRFTNIAGLLGTSGSNNYFENITSANRFFRQAEGNYSFFNRGSGWGFSVFGDNITVKNASVFHNFDNFLPFFRDVEREH